MKRHYLFMMVVAAMFSVFTIQAQQKAAFLSMYNSIDDIMDDDEKAAAIWFVNSYGGDFMPVSQFASGNLDDYSVIWFHVDKEDGNGQVPDVFLMPVVLDKMKAWYKSGGNLLLTTHASTYLTKLDRIDIAPDINGAGAGFNDSYAVWSFFPTWGTGNTEWEVINRMNDPLFKGLHSEQIQRPNGNLYDYYPLLGPGWREDHNVGWSCNFNDDQIAKLRSFEQYYNVTGLSSWFFITTYHAMGSVRWHPTGEYQGTAITLASNEYEWKQKTPGNPVSEMTQGNVEKMTANALNELKNGKKIAYLSAYNSVAEISDEEEKLAVQWFVDNEMGDFIPISQLFSINMDDYGVIWIDADPDIAVNIWTVSEALPVEFRLFETIEYLKDWYKAGGNLLLTKFAAQYLYQLGRIDFPPSDVISGGTGYHMDDELRWLTASFGTEPRFPEVIDRSGDPIYAGMTPYEIIRPDGNTYNVFPTLTRGWYKDHGLYWFGIPDNCISKLRLFEQYYNMQALSTWGDIENYRIALMARWFPTEEFGGACITIGGSAYEWHQNSDPVPGISDVCHQNLEQLTANALNELRNVGGTSVGVLPSIKKQLMISLQDNQLKVLGQEGKAKLYNIYGVTVGEYNAAQLANGVNVSSLPHGAYVISLYDSQGTIIANKKIIK